MKKYWISFIVAILLGGLTNAHAGFLDLNFNMRPNYSGFGVFGVTIIPDCLEAFVGLHKTLTIEEGGMMADLGVAKIEMGGVESNSSNYSSHEQLWEKRLKENHFLQIELGAVLLSVTLDVVRCATDYANYTEYLNTIIKTHPEAGIVWVKSSEVISNQLSHAKYLAENIGKAQLFSRSTSAEKYKMLTELKGILSSVRKTIETGKNNTKGIIYRVNPNSKPRIANKVKEAIDWSKNKNKWF